MTHSSHTTLLSIESLYATGLQEAQLNALSALTHEQASVNDSDRSLLLRLLSGMRNLKCPLSRSPLASPSVGLSVRHFAEYDGATEASSARDPQFDIELSRALRFAHRNYRSAPTLAMPLAESKSLQATRPDHLNKLAAQKRMRRRFPLFWSHALHVAEQREGQAAARAAMQTAAAAAQRVPATRADTKKLPKTPDELKREAFLHRSLTSVRFAL
jgi:hypothetical protein